MEQIEVKRILNEYLKDTKDSIEFGRNLEVKYLIQIIYGLDNSLLGVYCPMCQSEIYDGNCICGQILDWSRFEVLKVFDDDM